MNDIGNIAGRIGARLQQTLRNPINCTGVGLHCGLKINMTLKPAEAGTGIRFRRVDIVDRDNEIPARYNSVVDTVLCTSIANEAGVRVATIEHLMAALSGLSLDNLLVELDGPEVPIMDGSSAPFVFLAECAGIVEQNAARKSIRVLSPVVARSEDSYCSLTPSRGFSVGFEIDFDSAAVCQSDGYFDLHDGAFKRDIARARTFGFETDVKKLWDLGLAQGGSLENAVVVSADDVILNDGGLRYHDEFVRHKVLDSVGDLYLAGAPIIGHFQGVRSGHTLNNALLHKLFANSAAWTTTTQMAQPTLAIEDAVPAPAIA